MDTTGNRDWHWIVDNSSLTFNSWASGQPQTNANTCVVANIKTSLGNPPGKWFVSPCASNRRFICERDRVSESN